MVSMVSMVSMVHRRGTDSDIDPDPEPDRTVHGTRNRSTGS
jgi:hypothetical protein